MNSDSRHYSAQVVHPGSRLLAGADYSTYLAGARTPSEYVDKWPSLIAGAFAAGKLSKHQLRAFYGEVKRAEAAYKSGQDFTLVYKRLLKLKPAVDARQSRHKVPDDFKKFIDLNVDGVGAQGTQGFEKFVDHFESVVAYCEGRLKDGQ